jgi:hypothetical protein
VYSKEETLNFIEVLTLIIDWLALDMCDSQQYDKNPTGLYFIF